jgi:energy-coupling factor transport system ATP-binding protein
MQGGPCAFVFQNPDHQIVMPTVAAEVALSTKAQNLEGTTLKEHVMQALRRMRLEHLAEGTTATLSGGEKQRLVIAAALAQGPPLPQVLSTSFLMFLLILKMPHLQP